jgi:hypothetical protein
MIETDVLIVGGSLVGLSAATFLAWHGVPSVSVERHYGTAIHPRAGHFHLRTLEALRSVGLEGVRAASEGIPGTRGPHVGLESVGRRISSLDLFGKNFVLLAASGGGAWCEAARAAASELALPLDAYRIAWGEAVSDADDNFAAAYGLSPSGAALARPDGFVAWRAKDAAGASKAAIRSALSSLVCAPAR